MRSKVHARNGRTGPAWCGAGFLVAMVSFLRRDLVDCQTCRRMWRARGYD